MNRVWIQVSFLTLLAGASAWAQADALFGNRKDISFREEELDRRFLQSRINRALTQGAPDPACASVIGGLLIALAEAAPTLHRQDENFYLDPVLGQALDYQLTLPRFPAKAYVAAMVRRVMIDGKMPREWLEVAKGLRLPLLDTYKLAYLADGVKPIDSFALTLPVFRERYETEVVRATSAAAESAEEKFREDYLIRDVTWGGLTLQDVTSERAMKRGRSGRRVGGGDVDGPIALLQYKPPAPRVQSHLDLLTPKKGPPPINIIANLEDKQYPDLSRLPKGTRVAVRGRVWEMNDAMTEVRIKDALIFEDRDWAASGVTLAFPGAVAKCQWAVNELTGASNRQPGGFGQRMQSPGMDP